MRLKIFKCQKCEEYYSTTTDKTNIVCGALVGFTEKRLGPITIDTPVGCGGTLVESTQDEAIEAAYARRDKNG